MKWDPTVEWVGGLPGAVRLIDQTLLPGSYRRITCRRLATLWEAIRALRVRGAPAIGAAAALGVVLGLQRSRARDWKAFALSLDAVVKRLGSARPTAVNLFWGLERMRAFAESRKGLPIPRLLRAMLGQARAVLEEDRLACRRMAAHGSSLIRSGDAILTHCNTGALATVDYGTALGVVFRAREQGKRIRVYADETRPLLQGARLTAWELKRAKIPVTLICDNMAAQVMCEGRVASVLVGADRIAANGDAANKIGTYSVAVLARAHRIPFYVVAPVSTIDFSTPTGKQIPIEQRSPEEVTHPRGVRFAPDGVDVYNPAFDVTPARLITAIVTEQGILRPPYKSAIRNLRARVTGGSQESGVRR